MASNRHKKKNKLPNNLEPIRSSQISVTNHAPPPSFFSSSIDNIIVSPVAPRRPRVMVITGFPTPNDECRQFPYGSVSRLIPLGQDVPPNLLADEEYGEEDACSKIEWVFRAEEEALHLKMDLPGVCGKDDVKISVVDNIIIVVGEVKEGIDWKGEFYLRPNLYKMDQVKAEMIESGVIVVSVPKVEEEERKEYIYPVKVEYT